MQIDRGEFIRLCAALALVGGCRGNREGAEPHVPAVDIEEGGEAGSAPEPIQVEPKEENPCADGREDLSACARLSPACEGLPQECLQLGDDLRAPIATAWAECFAKARPPKCRNKQLGACMRAAIMDGCTQPAMRERCEQVMEACRRAGLAPRYTLEQCAKIASAVQPSDEPTGWARVNWERMGPSSAAEACSIEYVLPYQPFGWMWR